MRPFKISQNFMFGTATSSTQIEGGDKNHTWHEWCESGRILDSSSTITACDHWNRVEEDTKLLSHTNVQTHRMSLEWSRIEPKPREYSKEAIEHYRHEIELLLENNIQPLITLHHFSDPLWFRDKGGWLNPDNGEYFIEYVRVVLEYLGDLVNEWITFNEPNVYSIMGYLIGIFPPGIRSFVKTFQVMGNIIKTHSKLYDLIHETQRVRGFDERTRVGFAMHIRIFDGISFLGKRIAKVLDYIFHTVFMEGMTQGVFKFPLSIKGYRRRKTADFLGINYYTRNIVEFVFKPSTYFYKLMHDKNLTQSDLGWDIYPEGIYRACKRYYFAYHLPIYITENGISDQFDNRRPKYIVRHLEQIVMAKEEGIDVQRYYHWTLMDNFEWLEGQTGNFGLYHCNFITQKRTARKSAALYAAICKKKEVTKEMIEEFDLEEDTIR